MAIMKLHGRNALITGGSQGLGEAIAESFVREGANVLLCARDPARLALTSGRLQKLAAPGQRVLARPCDVSSETQVNELVAFALAELGTLHVLVNNAGVYGPMGPTETVPMGEWQRAIEINLYGVLLPCRAMIPHFKQSGRGKIVVLSGGDRKSTRLNSSHT